MNIKYQYPMPASWEDFEDMCFRLALADGTISSGRKYGRRGQEQHGVDIVGKSDNSKFPNVGIQCKLKTEFLGSQLRAKELNEVYELSKKLKPALDKLYVATTLSRDTEISQLIDQINTSWQRRHFLEVWTWQDITDMLELHPGIAARYYPHLLGNDDVQYSSCGALEVFLGDPASSGATAFSARLNKLSSHKSFQEAFGSATAEVMNVISEYASNCLGVNKGKAKRVVLTFDGTELTVEDNGFAFNPLDTSHPVHERQMGLRTIQMLTQHYPALFVEYQPKDSEGANTFNRFRIFITDHEGKASTECSVHVDAAHFHTRGQGFEYFQSMKIPSICDPFTIHLGTTPYASSSGTHEMLVQLKTYLGERKLVVVVASHRLDLYDALKPAVDTWPSVSMIMK